MITDLPGLIPASVTVAFPRSVDDAPALEISDLACGKAGEYLVCADLIMKGYVAFPSEQGLSFDVVVQIGVRLAKIQVKTTRAAASYQRNATGDGRTPTYLFSVKRMGKCGKKRYSNGDVDIFALVALDSREIGYIACKDVKQTLSFRSVFFRGKYLDEVFSVRAKKLKEMRSRGMTYLEIAMACGIDQSLVHRICCRSKQRCDSRYLTDCRFEDAVKSLGVS